MHVLSVQRKAYPIAQGWLIVCYRLVNSVLYFPDGLSEFFGGNWNYRTVINPAHPKMFPSWKCCKMDFLCCRVHTNTPIKSLIFGLGLVIFLATSHGTHHHAAVAIWNKHTAQNNYLLKLKVKLHHVAVIKYICKVLKR